MQKVDKFYESIIDTLENKIKEDNHDIINGLLRAIGIINEEYEKCKSMGE